MKHIATISAKTYQDHANVTRPVNVPIYQSTTFESPSSKQHGVDFKRGSDSVYTRFGHPTLAAAGAKIAELEHAEAGLVFSSGMAAITTTLLTFLHAGDHVIAHTEIFAQTATFLDNMLRGLHIEVDFIDTKDTSQLQATIRKNTRVVYIETPSNPVLDIVDIRAVAEVTSAFRIPLLVDGTFASPYCQQPLSLGASIVIHSATKFLGGHSDVMSGAIAGSAELVSRVQQTQILLGGIMDPHAAWLLLRGIKTLAVRMDTICRNAYAVATFLAGKPGVQRVRYPFHETDPGYKIAMAQMKAGGGVVTFETEGGLTAARAFLAGLKMIPTATSLGGVESMIEIPYELDFGDEELGDKASIRMLTPGFIRLSVGIEAVEDILRDLSRGLEAARASRADSPN